MHMLFAGPTWASALLTVLLAMCCITVTVSQQQLPPDQMVLVELVQPVGGSAQPAPGTLRSAPTAPTPAQQVSLQPQNAQGVLVSAGSASVPQTGPTLPAAAGPVPRPATTTEVGRRPPAASSIAAATPTRSQPGPPLSRPPFPFPQCINKTLSYDVSFVGPLMFAQVGAQCNKQHRGCCLLAYCTC